MSNIVHYKGKLERVSVGFVACVKDAEKILKEKDAKEVCYYDNPVEQLCDDYEEYFYHPKTETLYRIISKLSHEEDEEIITAKQTDDPFEIEYELRYYNGGAGFEECLEEAMDKLNNK